MSHLNVLIVDDECELRKSLREIIPNYFAEISFSFEEAENGKIALEIVKQKNFDLVLMDVKMPELDGLTTLKAIKDQDPRIFVVIMTAHSNYQDAIKAIKDGAYDYFEKPIQKNSLITVINNCLHARELIKDISISNPIFDDDVETEFVGNSSQMREIFNLIYKLCKVETTVLVRGENGTGKELVARAIHMNSHRKDGPFIAVNCGAIPDNLIESEFFGHERGAFTGAIERKIGKFQAANNGTLFLDEIGELKPEMQVKLLRVIQDKTFTPIGTNREIKSNTRIIAATNRNLEKMIESGIFREDLFYRLNVLPIFLPPLRERLEDIERLVSYFIKIFNKKFNRRIEGITPETLLALKKHNWPGNIRELENFIERSFIIETGNMITNKSLQNELKREPHSNSQDKNDGNQNTTFKPLDFDQFKEDMEKDFIIKALTQNQGRINQTVATANIPKNTLLRKIRKYGINVKEFLGEKK
ncbi:MAG: sigma-54-dependent Fis family transcriptional regulator [Bdellovibrionaceae bacterium]|nr:sigma-54-dependent Fis family transcriptional regulator [Pseudobdellovibrionaceae bacterium]